MPEINVYSGTRPVGTIKVSDEGALAFSYDLGWPGEADAHPISLSMPDYSSTYRSPDFDNWLSNLLAEGESASALLRILGLGDNLSILLEMGADTAGTLSFGSPSDSEQWSFTTITDFYSTPELKSALPILLQDTWKRPLLAGAEGVYSTLAGSEVKTTLTVLDATGRPVHRLPGAGDQLAIPKAGAPSTIILKHDPVNLPGLVENEVFCLGLAREVGIPAAEASILSAGGKKALCVLRYDRRATVSGQIERVHQEDFAQANALPRSRKYEVGRLPGVTLAQLFETSRLLIDDGSDRLLDQVIFRILIGDVDGHAKNFAALLRPDGPVLAPLYDVASALPHPDVNRTLPQRIDGDIVKSAEIEAQHWEAIADMARRDRGDVQRRVVEMADAIVAKTGAVVENLAKAKGVERDQLNENADAIANHATTVKHRLSRKPFS